MSKSFKIGEIVAEKGKKASGFLTIQDDTAYNVKLLVGIINGPEKGPVICITGGLYGTIYPGIDACIRLYNELDPKKLKGTVITVPVIEMTGFQYGIDKSPIDDLSPSNIFPGDVNGTITYRIAYTLFNEVIKKSEYHLDLRGGDLWENLHHFGIYSITGNKEFDQKTEALSKIFGTKYYLAVPESKGSLISEACREGVYSVVLEAAKGFGTYDEEDILKNLKGINNMLKYLKMVEGQPDIPYSPKQEEFKIYQIKARVGGLLYLNNKYGQMTHKNEKLGEIRNLKGEVIQELVSPIDGIVHYTYPKHIKKPGDIIIGIRKVLE
jgi:hypothetical protein